MSRHNEWQLHQQILNGPGGCQKELMINGKLSLPENQLATTLVLHNLLLSNIWNIYMYRYLYTLHNYQKYLNRRIRVPPVEQTPFNRKKMADSFSNYKVILSILHNACIKCRASVVQFRYVLFVCIFRAFNCH